MLVFQEVILLGHDTIMLMKRHMKTLLLSALMLPVFVSFAQQLAAAPYGRGQYGTCNYGEGGCTISLATSDTVTLSLTPTTTGVYTIDNDAVEVTTNSDDGFTLSIESDAADSSDLEGDGGVISPVSGSPGSPTALNMNQWGYRVDGMFGFGAGPTSAVQNEPSSSLTFTGLPFSGSPAILAEFDESAPDGIVIDVWYGVRGDTSIPSGSYTRTLTYTAIAL